MQFSCKCGEHYDPISWKGHICPKCGRVFLDPFRKCRRILKLEANKAGVEFTECVRQCFNTKT